MKKLENTRPWERDEVVMAMMISRLVGCDTNVSEEQSASVFRVKFVQLDTNISWW
jgi:hypothetical protein